MQFTICFLGAKVLVKTAHFRSQLVELPKEVYDSKTKRVEELITFIANGRTLLLTGVVLKNHTS